ncbi:MAG: hypothetical protein J1F69_02065 [Clostridiales bacterium]|nr:hypothetical protein [Clostridiales bacterium]
MKRKIISLLTAAVCTFGASAALCACGGNDGKGGKGGNGGNGGITENTKFDSIVSQTIADSDAWAAAFDFGEVTSMSCKWSGTSYSGGELFSDASAKFDFKDNKGHLYMIEDGNAQEGYMYFDSPTLYSLRYDKDTSKWLRRGRDISDFGQLCVQAYMFDPLAQYSNYINRFSEFTYDNDKKGYVYTDTFTEMIFKFYGGKLAAVSYEREVSIHSSVDREQLLVYDIGGNQKVNIPTDFVDEQHASED